MRIYATTPIHVGPDELLRRQQRYVLMQQGVARFGKDATKIIFAERLQIHANGKTSL